MSGNFWQVVVAGLKKLVSDIESELSKVVATFGNILNQIITAEESQVMLDAKPFIQQVAINLQNEKPGLNAKDFISALIEASVPALQAEGIKLAHTAIGIVSSTVAHELNVTDAAGNAGTVS